MVQFVGTLAVFREPPTVEMFGELVEFVVPLLQMTVEIGTKLKSMGKKGTMLHADSIMGLYGL